MISAIEKNLGRGEKLLKSITDEEFSKATTPPYYSSIGSHMRHILDVYECVFDGINRGIIDFTLRKRNFIYEQSTQACLEYLNNVISKLNNLSDSDLTQKIIVTDDIGNCKVNATYTLAAALIQVHSHAIHHYAIIGFLVHNLGIELPDADFGYNPTTPKKELLG